eukprot:6716465-Pyramimonas_sp.AAC.1
MIWNAMCFDDVLRGDVFCHVVSGYDALCHVSEYVLRYAMDAPMSHGMRCHAALCCDMICHG